MTAVFDHVTIRVADRAASERFSRTAPGALGVAPSSAADTPDRVQLLGDAGSFSLVAGGGRIRNAHLAFPASDRGAVEALHRAAVAARRADNGAPGERP